MTSNYITVNGIRLHYMEEGDGELVVLLHGFPEFWYGWIKQIPVLAKKYKVVIPDMRGYNLSDKPSKVSDYKIEILSKDIAELIKGLGSKNAMIAGHDWGAAVAWAVAAFHPEQVKKLAIINVPHPTEMKRAFKNFNWAQIKRSWYIFFFQIPLIPEMSIGSEMFFIRTFKGLCINKKAVNHDDIQKYVQAYSHKNAAWAVLAYYRAAFRSFLTDKDLPKIKVPVRMLWGEHDKALGKELTYNTKNYCESYFDIFYDPTSGHFVQHDNPQWVNEKLLEYFETEF